MRIIANENVSGTVIRTLRDRRHDVLSVKESMRSTRDDAILARAQAEERLVITHDKGFGELAFRHGLPASCGVVLFRLSGTDRDSDVQAFKLTVTDDPHFSIIKADKRSRIQETAVTAEALLPGSPYDLWHEGETSRHVKDLSGAFAQLPHLPKMLKAQAIVETLVEGCEQGTFVLRLTRPDGSIRTWWRSRPDENALKDAALELVLPHVAELAEVAPELLAPDKLPGLWSGDEITVQDAVDYFDGSKVVQVEKDGYQEPVPIPKASQQAVEQASATAVEDGSVWFVAEPASIYGEAIPAGVLTPTAKLCPPPGMIAAAEILPENLPGAWQNDEASALTIMTNLSQKLGKTLPWKTVKDVITASLQARFTVLADGSAEWPCEIHAAQTVKLKVATGTADEGGLGSEGGHPNVLVANADLEPSEIQNLGDAMPQLLEIKAGTNASIKFHVRVEVGDEQELPSKEVVEQLNAVLKDVKDGFQVQ